MSLVRILLARIALQIGAFYDPAVWFFCGVSSSRASVSIPVEKSHASFPA
jgi:hypothetical protein